MALEKALEKTSGTTSGVTSGVTLPLAPSTWAPTNPPAPTNPLEFLYIVWYIPSRATSTASRVFHYESSDMQKVIARAKRHCECQSFRFLRVEQFVADLDKLDNFMLDKNG